MLLFAIAMIVKTESEWSFKVIPLLKIRMISGRCLIKKYLYNIPPKKYVIINHVDVNVSFGHNLCNMEKTFAVPQSPGNFSILACRIVVQERAGISFGWPRFESHLN